MRGAKKVTCVTYSSITRSIQKSKSKIIKKKLVSVSEQGQLIAFFRDAPRISSCMQKISERNRNGNIAANRYRQLNVACVVHCIRSIQAITRTTGGGAGLEGFDGPWLTGPNSFPHFFFSFGCVFFPIEVNLAIGTWETFLFSYVVKSFVELKVTPSTEVT